MTNWISKVKRVIEAFLATENDFYLTTEDGLRIQIVELNKYSERTKESTSWNNPSLS